MKQNQFISSFSLELIAIRGYGFSISYNLENEMKITAKIDKMG